jgi:chitinase
MRVGAGTVLLAFAAVCACGGAGGASSGGADGGAIEDGPAGNGSSSEGSRSSSPDACSCDASADGPAGPDASAGASPVFSAYKDTTVAMDWNTNVIATTVSGSMVALGDDLVSAGGSTVTLAFATGECGSETWGGVAGDALPAANLSLLGRSGVKYIVSTGGAAGAFTCASDAGMATFLGRWDSAGFAGVDFDIEAGQTSAVIADLVQRILAAHAARPSLRFSLTLGTLAANDGAATAQSLGSSAADPFNVYGDEAMSAVEGMLGFAAGQPSTWPAYLTINLMTMDYGAPQMGVCVVASGSCQMGQSALQAAYDLHDHLGVPYGAIELTPMIGGNDVTSEHFTLADADTVAAFALGQGLAGVHFWSYDRDVDCAEGPASSTCNTSGVGYAGPHGFLKEFLAGGLR